MVRNNNDRSRPWNACELGGAYGQLDIEMVEKPSEEGLAGDPFRAGAADAVELIEAERSLEDPANRRRLGPAERKNAFVPRVHAILSSTAKAASGASSRSKQAPGLPGSMFATP